jgi:hypothetical protein
VTTENTVSVCQSWSRRKHRRALLGEQRTETRKEILSLDGRSEAARECQVEHLRERLDRRRSGIASSLGRLELAAAEREARRKEESEGGARGFHVRVHSLGGRYTP